ncbi:MAG: IclR family transcriptional regulator [Paracoccaceae bacterium]
MQDTSPPDQKYRAPALSKGLDILEMLASESEGRTQVEIAKALGRTTSEIFRMLMVLRQRGYVVLDDSSDRYALTTKLFEVAHRHPPVRRLTALAGDEMQRLANRINQSLHLAILHSGKALVIAQVDSPDNNVTFVRLGAQVPLYDSASGRVLAAWLDETALAALLDLAGPETDGRRGRFLADLPKLRENGACISPSLMIEGVLNISAPIRDFSGKVVAAMTIPFVRRLAGGTSTDAGHCAAELQAICQRLSRQLGAQAHQ